MILIVSNDLYFKKEPNLSCRPQLALEYAGKVGIQLLVEQTFNFFIDEIW